MCGGPHNTVSLLLLFVYFFAVSALLSLNFLGNNDFILVIIWLYHTVVMC